MQESEDKNYQKKILALFAILVFVFLCVSFFIYRLLFAGKVIDSNNIIDKITDKINIAVENGSVKDKKQVFAESKDWYDTRVEYPQNNLTVKNNIFKIYNDFASETQILQYAEPLKAREELGLFSDDMKYSFDAKYISSTSTNGSLYLYEIYTFTGGAHGSSAVVAYNLDNTDSLVNIETILPIKILPEISKIAEVQIKEEKVKRMLASGMTKLEIKEIQKNDEVMKEGLTPIRENYNIAWYDKDFVIIHFGQYQVASYAEGMFEVRIPKSTIEELKTKYK